MTSKMTTTKIMKIMAMMMLTTSALQGTDAKLALSPALQGRKANMRRQ